MNRICDMGTNILGCITTHVESGATRGSTGFALGCEAPSVTCSPESDNKCGSISNVGKVDDATMTTAARVLKGDPRYSSFSWQVQLVSRGDTTEVTWTAKYEPVGDMGPSEEKALSALILKTLECAVLNKTTLTHVQTLDASPEDIWKDCEGMDAIFSKPMPKIFETITLLNGHSEPGSVQVVMMGPAVTLVGKITESIDLFDKDTRKLGYTVLKGHPRYWCFHVTVQINEVLIKGTTKGLWMWFYGYMDNVSFVTITSTTERPFARPCASLWIPTWVRKCATSCSPS
uniref:Bet v I/Major latex protein domain-containing protein n=1 Tax=Physcomitrium patens TaxID=3218 RepID=A0A2K1KK43_PHYPA|nr:hypothetical protein PHYPA_007822 [Physcomitrium patens]